MSKGNGKSSKENKGGENPVVFPSPPPQNSENSFSFFGFFGCKCHSLLNQIDTRPFPLPQTLGLQGKRDDRWGESNAITVPSL